MKQKEPSVWNFLKTPPPAFIVAGPGTLQRKVPPIPSLQIRQQQSQQRQQQQQEEDQRELGGSGRRNDDKQLLNLRGDRE